MTSLDTDLRSERRLETGRRSESIIYICISKLQYIYICNIAYLLQEKKI
jgi:hypothetical protein